MKHYSRLILAAFAIMMVVPAHAQYRGYNSRYGRTTYNRPASRNYGYSAPYTYYGFRVGLNGATVNSDDKFLDGGSMQSGLNVGFNVGVLLTQTTPLFFETGLQYTEKGGKGNYGNNKFTYDLNYLEVPLVLKYQCKIDRDIAITPFLGGYLACGVGGKIKDFGDRVSEPSFSEHNFKRFDGGLRLGCGIMLDMFYAEVGYDAGLANISNDTFDSAHTGTLFANIGINF